MLRAAAAVAALAAGALARPAPGEVLIFEDTFTTLNTSLWKHEITLSGGGNWEFQWYNNNRSVSYVRNGSLVIGPRLTNDSLTTAGLSTADVNLWGGDPANTCTNNFEYGCERQGGGGNIINPVRAWTWPAGRARARALIEPAPAPPGHATGDERQGAHGGDVCLHIRTRRVRSQAAAGIVALAGSLAHARERSVRAQTIDRSVPHTLRA